MHEQESIARKMQFIVTLRNLQIIDDDLYWNEIWSIAVR